MSIYPKRPPLPSPDRIERAQIVLNRSQPGLPRVTEFFSLFGIKPVLYPLNIRTVRWVLLVP